MKVIGKGAIKFHDAPDECPRTPGQELLWQESFVLMAWDVVRDVYVFLRISRVPNKGVATAWLNLWVKGSFYKKTEVTLPLSGVAVTETSLSVGDGLCSYEYDDGRHHWKLHDAEAGIDAAFTCEDGHQGMSYYPDAQSSFVTEGSGTHTEATGAVTGALNFQGNAYRIAGTGWRDHSWGKRNWIGIRAHRFFSANFGDQAHFACVSFIGEDGQWSKNGMVIRQGEVHFTRDFSIIAHIGEDGVSNCGGQLRVALPDRSYALDFEPIGKAAISVIDGFPCVNSLCRVRMDGQQGVGVAETSNNAQAGTQRPFIFPDSTGVIENGVFLAPASI